MRIRNSKFHKIASCFKPAVFIYILRSLKSKSFIFSCLSFFCLML